MKAFKQVATKMGDFQSAQAEDIAVHGPFRQVQIKDFRKLELDKRHLLKRHIVLADKDNAHNDAFKILRSQLMRAFKERDVKVIGVTSTHAGQGKTTISCNLAMCIARLKNQFSVLVDYDLRRPNVGATLGLPACFGVNDYISSDEPLSEMIVHPKGISNLFILPGGKPTTDSSEIIHSNRFQGINAFLKQTHKNCVVVVDLPPVLVSDDVMELMDFLDGVVVVVEEGKTQKKDLQLLNEIIGEEKRLGYVMNRATESAMSYGYGYRY